VNPKALEEQPELAQEPATEAPVEPADAETAPAEPASGGPTRGESPAAGTLSPAGHPWRRALQAGLLVWVVSRVGLAFVTAFAWLGSGSGMPQLSYSTAAYKWASQWDSAWFIAIADIGYKRAADDANAAFFPLYPALIRLFTPVFFGHSWLAALVVANVALLAALVLLYRVMDEEFGAAPASRAVFYLLAYPTAFFLTAAYNEGLFIALMVGSVFCMRRGHWWMAAVLGALAGATRSAGILLVLPFCYEYIRQHGRRLRLNVLALAVMPLGLVTVMIIDKRVFDDPLAFSHSQAVHWGRNVTWPWKAVIETFGYLDAKGVHVHNLLELGTTLLVLAMVVLSFVGPWRFRRDQLVYPLFGLALILFMISFPSSYRGDIPYPLLSTSRIGLEIFPAFMMMGRLGRNPWLDRLFLVVFLPLQGLLIVRFLNGSWVA
jgi:hypothetical protein